MGPYCVAEQDVSPTTHIKRRLGAPTQPSVLDTFLGTTSKLPYEEMLFFQLKMGATFGTSRLLSDSSMNSRGASKTHKLNEYCASWSEANAPALTCFPVKNGSSWLRWKEIIAKRNTQASKESTKMITIKGLSLSRTSFR